MNEFHNKMDDLEEKAIHKLEQAGENRKVQL